MKSYLLGFAMAGVALCLAAMYAILLFPALAYLDTPLATAALAFAILGLLAVAYRPRWFIGGFAVLACVMLVAVMLVGSPAFAADVVAPVGNDASGGLVSLWGPTLGIITAVVIFFDRLAKVIPNSTTNTILSILLKVATVLGAKVTDQK